MNRQLLTDIFGKFFFFFPLFFFQLGGRRGRQSIPPLFSPPFFPSYFRGPGRSSRLLDSVGWSTLSSVYSDSNGEQCVFNYLPFFGTMETGADYSLADLTVFFPSPPFPFPSPMSFGTVCKAGGQGLLSSFFFFEDRSTCAGQLFSPPLFFFFFLPFFPRQELGTGNGTKSIPFPFFPPGAFLTKAHLGNFVSSPPPPFFFFLFPSPPKSNLL